MNVIGVIPARLESTRLPKKLLLNATGKTLLQHTWEAAQEIDRLDQIVIGTDSIEIAEIANDFGGVVVMTAAHRSGTDRVAEVISRKFPECRYVVNIQGDEPELDPSSINKLIDTTTGDKKIYCATMACPIQNQAQYKDPNVVKVVCADSSFALYFSRAPIPHFRKDPKSAPPNNLKQHIGIYVFTREFLLQFTSWATARLEECEQLEQLRILEAGKQIFICDVEKSHPGIDTSSDYESFVSRQLRDD